MEDLSKTVGDKLPAEASFVTFGSLARKEFTAESDLVCFGLTYWDFGPLVQDNGLIAWKLLQSMARELRTAQQSLVFMAAPNPAPAEGAKT